MNGRKSRKPSLSQVWAFTANGRLVAIGETLERAERIIWNHPPVWETETWGVHTKLNGIDYRIERWIVR